MEIARIRNGPNAELGIRNVEWGIGRMRNWELGMRNGELGFGNLAQRNPFREIRNSEFQNPKSSEGVPAG